MSGAESKAKIVYCDHHLTSEGWQPGSIRRDDGSFESVSAPVDTFMTIRYSVPTHGLPYVTTVWRTDKNDVLDQLTGQYGELPEALKEKV